MGQSPTTLGTPFNDVGIGVRQAIISLQELIERHILDSDFQLILPSLPEGAGVDTVVATVSAGPALKTVLVGLLADVSLDSAQKLARTTYSRVVETFSLSDKRKPQEQIDSIYRQTPDLIIVTGGTEGGATRSIQKLMEVVGLSCFLAPAEKRPFVLYAGNNKLADDIKSLLGGLSAGVQVSPNIRPSLEVEDIDPAHKDLAITYGAMRRRQVGGVEELTSWSSGTLMPNAYARGRMVRFLGKLYETPGRGVLGVDVGASSVTVASSFEGELSLNVFTQFGLGEPLAGILRYTTLEEIMQWLPVDVPADLVRDYLYLKALYPATIPATTEDLAIEQALARQVLRLAMRTVLNGLPRAQFVRPGMLPQFEPIIAGGAALASAPTHGQSLLMLLDALQPIGITRILLDQNNLLPALGAAAEKNTILPVHVMESWAFVNLATIVSPISSANYGAPILRVRMIYKDGNETKVEVKQGGLDVFQLANGQTARLELQPLQRTDVGAGPGRMLKVDLTGGVLGLIVDARGRPLKLPPDAVRRRDLIKKWLWTVGG